MQNFGRWVMKVSATRDIGPEEEVFFSYCERTNEGAAPLHTQARCDGMSSVTWCLCQSHDQHAWLAGFSRVGRHLCFVSCSSKMSCRTSQPALTQTSQWPHCCACSASLCMLQ